MAVNNDTATTGPLYGDGSNTSFPFDFIAASADEVAVYVDGLQLAGNAFSVALQDDGTGTVTTTVAPANGAEIYLASDPSFTETVQFERYGPYFPDQINPPLDRAAIRSIYLRGVAQRALLAPVGEVGISLPGAAVRANKMLAFDGAGNALPTAIPTLPARNPDYAGLFLAYDAEGIPTASSGTGVDAGLRTDLAEAGGAALLGYTNASVQSTLATTLRLTDYITASDADATSGWYDWIAALNSNANPYVYGVIPSGAYELASATLQGAIPTITRDGVTIVGEGLPTVTVIGTGIPTANLQFLNCSGRVQGIRWIGNSGGTGYTNGCALQFFVDPTATKDTEYVEVVDCVFDNFKSPYWVYTYVSNQTLGVKRVLYQNNTAFSRDGNSLLPSSQGQIDAVLVVKSKWFDGSGNPFGGGGVRNVLIADNTIDATYIKTGIFLADNVQVATISRNKVIGAGVSGATDAAGAYAFASYDSDKVGMANISYIDCEIDGVRSCGIYAAGVDGLVIQNIVGRNQTDTNDVALPKGLVVLNGANNFRIDGIKADNIANGAVYQITDSRADTTTIGSIRNVHATNCKYAVELVSAYNPSTIELSGIYARECTYSIQINADDGGLIDGWNITNLNVVTSVAGAYGVRLYTEGTGTGFKSITIGGNSHISTPYAGIGVAGMQAGKIKLDGITFENPFSLAAVYADSAYGLAIDNLTFNDQDATGACFRLSSATGTIGLGIKFNGVASGHQLAADGGQLGGGLPTHTSNAGSVVRNFSPAAGGFTHWVNTDGGTTWKQAGTIAA